MIELVSRSPEQTRALGATLGAAIRSASVDIPLVVALNGELGAGKTTFVGGLMRALGVEGPVKSPTYTLIEPYELPHKSGVRHVYHLDLYRLADAGELEMLAPRDLLEPGAVLLVEWAERGGRALPQADLSLQLCYADGDGENGQRRIVVDASSQAGRVLAACLKPASNEDRLSN